MKINDKGLAAYASSRRGIDKEGFLDKKGDLNHSYKKRWFALKGNLLFYFEKPADKQPVGMIILENCSVEVSDCDRYSFCIRFQSFQSTSRTYTLCAENDTEMERWMKCITSASFGYIDMLVKEFEKNLQRLKTIESSTDDTSRLSQEQCHSEILLSKAKSLLDHPNESDLIDSLPKAPPRSKKNSNSSNLKDKVANNTISSKSRSKTKSLILSPTHRSKSSENIAKERSPTAGRKTLKGVRTSAPPKELVNNNVILADENDKTTFELLHTSFGGAIWTKIGETI